MWQSREMQSTSNYNKHSEVVVEDDGEQAMMHIGVAPQFGFLGDRFVPRDTLPDPAWRCSTLILPLLAPLWLSGFQPRCLGGDNFKFCTIV